MVKLLIPTLATLVVAAGAFWLFAERPADVIPAVAPDRASPVKREPPPIPALRLAAPVAPAPPAAPATVPSAPPAGRLMRLPSVQVVRVPEPEQFDAPGTGGPYFTHKLRRWIRRAGVPTEKIRMTVTRSHLILTGSVNSEAARAQVAAVVDSRTPRQLTVDNRIEVRAPVPASTKNELRRGDPPR